MPMAFPTRLLSIDSITGTVCALKPIPSNWLDLARLRTCRVIGAAIGSNRSNRPRQGQSSKNNNQNDETQQPILFRFGDGSGGLVGADFDNKDAKTEQDDGAATAASSSYNRHVFVISIRDILQRYHVPNVIDYFSLDVEGAESLVMMDFTLGRLRH
jgi:hypothetical protein